MQFKLKTSNNTDFPAIVKVKNELSALRKLIANRDYFSVLEFGVFSSLLQLAYVYHGQRQVYRSDSRHHLSHLRRSC